MSYADVAAKGPKQSAEENSSRAPPVPSLELSEPETSSLVDVDSPHVSTVESDFKDAKVKTQTQATRLAHEAEDHARAAEKSLADAAATAKKRAATKGKEAKDALKRDGKTLSDNRDNPVVIGNAVILGVGIVALAFGAYKTHSEGKLDWKVAGTTAALVGALGVADYFGSKWLLENKYPPK